MVKSEGVLYLEIRWEAPDQLVNRIMELDIQPQKSHQVVFPAWHAVRKSGRTTSPETVAW